MMKRTHEEGFSMIELLIAMAILAVVLTGVVQLFSATNRYSSAQEMLMSLNQELRTVKNLMVDEIRSAGTNPYANVRLGFLTDGNDDANTDANSIHFTRDIDGTDTNGDLIDDDVFFMPDGDANDSNEEISYFRTNDNCEGAVGALLNAGDATPGCLRRRTGSAGAAAQPMMNNITELQFIYYDFNDAAIPVADLNTTNGLDRIRSVDVLIVGQVDNPVHVNAAARAQTLQFHIMIRNS